MTSKEPEPKTLDSFLRKVESVALPLQEIGRAFPVGRTRAQKARTSENPYLSAVASCIRREVLPSENHLNDRKVFHFDDGSFLAFSVSYSAIEDGRS